MKWMFLPLLRYADFSGRSRRLEYWMFTLFITIMIFGLIFLMLALSGQEYQSEDPLPFAGVWIGLLVVLGIGIFIPSLAVQVRRLHDQDLSGWWILLGFIPYIGGLIIFIFTLIPSQPHDNQWGPVPYGVRVRGYPPT
jgi:uncharacterized membrane protein YhaH (DUF805 family)